MKNNYSLFRELMSDIFFFVTIICLFCFWQSDKLNGQELTENKEINGSDSEDSIEDDGEQDTIKDSLTEKAKESAEKKQTLEELLAVPFNQIKSDEDAKLELLGKKNDTDNQVYRKEGDVKLPPPPEQRKVETDLEKQIDEVLREELPKEYVGVSVSIRYILETVPVTKRDKVISKIKLPGFENNVWVPTQTKKIVGIVNQVRPYTTVFAVVNTPISLFNVEVLRQTLDERIKFLNLTGRDVLKLVHVPFTTPLKSSVASLENAAAEIEKSDIKIALADNSSINETEKGLSSNEKKLEPEVNKKETFLESDPEPTQVDLKAKVETTRYLLQARKNYFKENYDGAITALRRAIEINPYSSQAFAMLGSIYYRLGWNKMALDNWKHALELDPTNEGLKKYLMRVSSQ